MTTRTGRSAGPLRDRGFTLPELLICIVLMAVLATVLSMTIITSLRVAPDTTSRADTAIALQGITTNLPPDVDSTEPDGFDIDPATPSGCASGNTGQNIVRMQWHETFAGTTTSYVANYRFVASGGKGQIVRLACSGTFSLGAGIARPMSASLSSTPPSVVLSDGDSDGHKDQLKMSITTLSGTVFVIDAASKNPANTLAPTITNPTTTLAPTTTVANQPPTASPVTLVADQSVVTTFDLLATDPELGVLTAVVNSLPAGWSAPTSGLQVSLNPGSAAAGTYPLGYTVTDPTGLTATSTITVQVPATPTATTTPPPTTSTTTTTTTTTLPPCVVSSVALSDSTMSIQGKGQGLLQHTVTVTAVIAGGYCVGLTLQYDTGGPNGQKIQNFSAGAPYQVQLIGHPQGTELWAAGTRTLQVRNSANAVLAQVNLVVTE